MFLLRSLDADNRPLWLLNEGDQDLIPVTFMEGLHQLQRESSRQFAPAENAFAFPESNVLKNIPLLPPFGGTKIMCVGRNYKPHAEELGNEIPREPLWFTKPPSSLLENQGTILLPAGVGRVDYEGELALVIGRSCHNLLREEALSVVAGITAAIDVTARELQKSDGQWTRAKGFDTFCPLGPGIVPFRPDWLSAKLTTSLNGKTVQKDNLTSLIFSVPALLVHLSACMTLEPGDVILTGTPAGVGPLHAGDRLEVTLEAGEIIKLSVQIAEFSGKSQSGVQL